MKSELLEVCFDRYMYGRSEFFLSLPFQQKRNLENILLILFCKQCIHEFTIVFTLILFWGDKKNLNWEYLPCGRMGGVRETTTLTHFLVQFDWRQHLSPRLQISSDRQPFTAGHAGIGFSTGHSPGLLPKVNSKQISKNLWMQRISFSNSRIAYPQLIIISNVWHSSPQKIKNKNKIK